MNNKWQDWYSNLPAHTKAYLKTQPVWKDRDLGIAMLIAFAVGYITGAVFFW